MPPPTTTTTMRTAPGSFVGRLCDACLQDTFPRAGSRTGAKYFFHATFTHLPRERTRTTPTNSRPVIRAYNIKYIYASWTAVAHSCETLRVLESAQRRCFTISAFSGFYWRVYIPRHERKREVQFSRKTSLKYEYTCMCKKRLRWKQNFREYLL